MPGKALSGVNARRRAVEGAGDGDPNSVTPILRPRVPAAADASRASPLGRQSPSNPPATAWPVLEPRCPFVAGGSAEMEVIRDQFRLYVWAAVSSFRRCDSCGTRGCLAAR